MDDSTTSPRQAGEVLGAMGGRWVKCDVCAFEYPTIGDIQCPQCNPPSKGQDEPARDDAERIVQIMAGAGVNPYAWQHATLDSFDAEHDEDALQKATQWLSNWQASHALGHRWPRRDWLYFYGADSSPTTLGRMGNGKTHLAVAICRELIGSGLVEPDGFRFTTAESLLLEMEATFRSRSSTSELDLLKRYERYELLVVDDFGVREPSDHALRILDELTKRREARGTIWTSNHSLRTVAHNSGLHRVASRIAGMCGVGGFYAVKFNGPDRRIERSRSKA